ncbi:hypothetical protein EDC01DRAFT_784867 [Geopyxis carbonaria]|nr:hypothetical protein EDC01DRAFT_784867 [Geopyxis carbonaria]
MSTATPTAAKPAAAPTPTVAILSMGRMGTATALMLQSHSIPVLTTVHNRSATTSTNAASASVRIAPSDIDLINTAPLLISLVPPSAALSVARRIAWAYAYYSPPTAPTAAPIYLDLSTTTPATARAAARVFAETATLGSPGPRYVDGAVLGGPAEPVGGGRRGWRKPRVVVCGAAAGEVDVRVSGVLGLRVVGGEVGMASALGSAFWGFTRGVAAVGVEAMVVAASAGMGEELRREVAAVRGGQQVLRLVEEGLAAGGGEVEGVAAEGAREVGWRGGVMEGGREVWRVVDEAGGEGGVEEVVGRVGGLLRGKRKREEEAAEAARETPEKKIRPDDSDADDADTGGNAEDDDSTNILDHAILSRPP